MLGETTKRSQNNGHATILVTKKFLWMNVSAKCINLNDFFLFSKNNRFFYSPLASFTFDIFLNVYSMFPFYIIMLCVLCGITAPASSHAQI